MVLYESELTPFESSELSKFPLIYTVGSVRVYSRAQVILADNHYRITVGEQIGYRYLVEKVLDSGAFGQVCRCVDMRDSGKYVAVKISRDRQIEATNAQVEAKILRKVLRNNRAIQMLD
jgi:hypothetical protein